jgi:calcineurin-like phosphoesterase family protein
VFFLGDLCFKSGTGRGEGEPYKAINYLEQLNCKNIIFINGNHDSGGKNSFKTIIQNLVISYGGKRIFLVHNPEYVNTYYDFALVGHVHEKWMFKRIRRGETFIDCCNVGVDVWNFYPVNWQQIDREYHKWLKTNNLTSNR